MQSLDLQSHRLPVAANAVNFAQNKCHKQRPTKSTSIDTHDNFLHKCTANASVVRRQSIISLLKTLVHSTPAIRAKSNSNPFPVYAQFAECTSPKWRPIKYASPIRSFTHGTHERYQPIRLQTQRKLTAPFGGIPVSGPQSARFIHTAVSLACGCVTARDRRGSGCVARVASEWPCVRSHFRADCRCRAARSVCATSSFAVAGSARKRGRCRRRGNTCFNCTKTAVDGAMAVRYIDR